MLGPTKPNTFCTRRREQANVELRRLARHGSVLTRPAVVTAAAVLGIDTLVLLAVDLHVVH